jgi:hypothetical protein
VFSKLRGMCEVWRSQLTISVIIILKIKINDYTIELEAFAWAWVCVQGSRWYGGVLDGYRSFICGKMANI